MENIISSNIDDAVAPWYYLTESIISIIIGVTLVSIILLSILMLINKVKHKRIGKVIIVFWVIFFILFFITYATSITESILIDIFRMIYGLK